MGITAIYFCSAYNDVVYILGDIFKRKPRKALVIVSSKIKLFDFLNDLQIKNIEVQYFDSKLNSFKRLKAYYNEILNLKEIKGNITAYRNVDVYFFPLYFDLITLYCVYQLSYCNNIHQIRIPGDLTGQKLKGLKLKTFLASLIYRIPLCNYRVIDKDAIGFCENFIKANVEPVNAINQNEKDYVYNFYSIKLKFPRNFILYLSSGDDFEIIGDEASFDDITLKILKVLKEIFGNNIALKGHPKYGISIILKDKRLNLIPNNIPIEFINLKNCICVLGLSSFAMSNFCNSGLNVLSTLELYEVADQELREYKKLDLNMAINSEEKQIFYPNTLLSLRKFLIDLI